MQGHMYTATVQLAAVTVIQDFFQLLAAAAVPIVIHSIRIGQSTEAGDAAAEMLRIRLARTDFTINGSGGSTLTPEAHSPASPAASTVVEANNTTLSTVQVPILEDVFNVQAGWLYVPTERERLIIPAGVTNGFIVGLPVAPADPMDMTGSIIFEEIK